jgi:hypothetical protein
VFGCVPSAQFNAIIRARANTAGTPETKAVAVLVAVRDSGPSQPCIRQQLLDFLANDFAELPGIEIPPHLSPKSSLSWANAAKAYIGHYAKRRPATCGNSEGVDAVNTPAGTRRSRCHYGPTTFNSRRRPCWSSTRRSAGWGTGRRMPRTGRRPRRAPPRSQGRADHRTTARRLRRDADARELSQSRRRVERAVARCRTCRGVWSISTRTAWKRRPGASGSKPTLLSAMASTIRSTAPSLRQSPCSPTPSRRRSLTWCCIPMWIAGGSDKVRLCIAAKCAQLYQLHIGARRVRPQVAGAGRPLPRCRHRLRRHRAIGQLQGGDPRPTSKERLERVRGRSLADVDEGAADAAVTMIGAPESASGTT